VHVRNLRENPACALHLEDGWRAVILAGTARQADPPGKDLARRLSAAYSRKYHERGYQPEPDSWDGPGAGGLLVFTPAKAMAWFDFPNDATRFHFEP
jgi:hypothetical protein